MSKEKLVIEGREKLNLSLLAALWHGLGRGLVPIKISSESDGWSMVPKSVKRGVGRMRKLDQNVVVVSPSKIGERVAFKPLSYIVLSLDNILNTENEIPDEYNT